MVRTLGAIDIITATMLIARVFHWEIPIGMLIFVGLCLIAKAVISITNFFGWIDIVALGLLIAGAFITMPLVLMIAALVMVSKGIVSLCSSG